MTDVVLLVPGFAASHLYTYKPFRGSRERLWLAEYEIALTGIEHLENSDRWNPVGPKSVVAPSVLEEVYQPFARLLNKNGIEYHQWPYDWRGDIRTNARALLADLQQYRHGTRRVHVVGHSMGGLVAMAALQEMDTELARSFPNLVTMGTPWHGAYRSVELLTGQHEIVRQIAGLYRLVPRWDSTRWEKVFAQVAATWPGVFEMLPSDEMIRQHQVPADRYPFNAAWWTGINVNVTQPKLDAGHAFNLRQVGLPDGIQHHNWRALWKTTPGPMPIRLADGTLYQPKELRGDGTVPEFSSYPPAVFNSVVRTFDAEHSQFTNDPFVMQLFRQLVGF